MGVPPSEQAALSAEAAMDVIAMGIRLRRIPSAAMWDVEPFASSHADRPLTGIL